jgi:phospholipase/lecithinase/hemolysin
MAAYLSDIDLALENLNLGSLNLGSLNLGSFDLGTIASSLLAFANSDRASLRPNATNLARTEGFSQVVVFGDSLSDTGNLASLLTENGLPTPNGLNPSFINGRLSNGPLWIETFAANQNLNPLQIKNFATIGSTTGRTNITSFLPPDLAAQVNLPGMLDQIDRYGTSLNPQADPQALHVIWGGGADFYAMQGKTWLEAIAQVNQSVNQVIAGIDQLVGLGATTIAVINLPDLGIVPGVQALGMGAMGTAYSLLFDGLLEFRLGQVEQRLDVDVIEVDLFSATETILANPQAFGLSDITTPLVTVNGLAVNPNAYLWWNGNHPTTAGHQLIAGAVQSALEGKGSQFMENGLALATNRLTQWIGGLDRGLDLTTVLSAPSTLDLLS